MNRVIALGAAVVGGAIALQLPKRRRRRVGAAINRRMVQHMEHMMARLPENSPPKLITSVLPQLRDQNDQVIAMLREQNALLRDHLQVMH